MTLGISQTVSRPTRPRIQAGSARTSVLKTAFAAGLIASFVGSSFGQTCECSCSEPGFEIGPGTVTFTYEEWDQQGNDRCTETLATGISDFCGVMCDGGADLEGEFTNFGICIRSTPTTTPFTTNASYTVDSTGSWSVTIGTRTSWDSQFVTSDCTSWTYDDSDSNGGLVVEISIDGGECTKIPDDAESVCDQTEDGGGEDCEGESPEDKGNDNESDDSVAYLTGHKIERSTDLVVRLPGRDFELVREYTSNTTHYGSGPNYPWRGESKTVRPGNVGVNWTTNTSRWLLPSGANGLVLGGVPVRSITRFELDENASSTQFVARSTANKYVYPTTVDVPGIGSGKDVYRLIEPGGHQIDFARMPSSLPTGDNGLGMEDINGLPVFERDKHGNEWWYEYAILKDNTLSPIDVVVLKAIHLNWDAGALLSDPSDDTWAARIEFAWNGQSGESVWNGEYGSGSGTTNLGNIAQWVDANSNGVWDLGEGNHHFGRLAEARVVRPDGSGETITKRARYLYLEDLQDILNPEDATETFGDVYDASQGDLCEVVVSTLVDADDGNSSDPYHERVWQYRYYTGSNNSYELDGIDFFGAKHQLLAAFYPQQIEFFADHYGREAVAAGVLTSAQESAAEAAGLRLRWISFDDLPGSNLGWLGADWEDYFFPNEYWQTLYDIASKVVSYHTSGEADGRVVTQVVNAGDGSSGSSCGCAGGSGFRLGKRYDYLYKRFDMTVPSGVPLSETVLYPETTGYSCQIVESYAGLTTTQPVQLVYKAYRVFSHDYYWPTALDVGTLEGTGKVGMPWKVASVVADADENWTTSSTSSPFESTSTGRRWVTLYGFTSEGVQPGSGQEFSAYHRVNTIHTPSAVNGDEYVPAAGDGTSTTAPTFPSLKSEGLTREFAYSGGWRSETTVTKGNTATSVTPVQMTYASQRSDLPTSITRSPGTGPTSDTPVESTTLSYGWHNSSAPNNERIVAWRETTVTAESQAQNGPNTTSPAASYSSYKMFDTNGQLRWAADENGRLTYYEYDELTGALVMTVQDADSNGSSGDPVVPDYPSSDASLPSSFPGLSSSGWSAPTDSAFEELSNSFAVDLLGRVTSHTDSSGNARYIRYEAKTTDVVESDGGLADRGIPFFARISLPYKLTGGIFDGPASISWIDAASQSIRTSRYSVDQTAAYTPSTGVFTLDAEQSRSDTERIVSGLALRSRIWHGIGDDAALSGTARTHTNAGSYVTSYEYDTLGRMKAAIDPEDGVTAYGSHDVMDRPLTTDSGVRDWSAGIDSVSETAALFYDSGQTETQGVGNGMLTLERRRVTASTSDDRITKRWYDYRDRLRGVKSPLAPHSVMEYDDLSRVVSTATFTSATGFTDGSDPDSALPDPDSAASSRSTYTQTLYNNRGMVYRTRAAIDPQTGTAGFLETNHWFDEEGFIIASWAPNGPATKTEYDALDRPSVTYTTDGGGDALPGAADNHTDASAVTGDRVLSQNEYAYVAGGIEGAGGVELITSRERMHDDTGTGALVAADSIATFALYEFDDASRIIKTHNYGTNGTAFAAGTSSPSRPSITSGSPDTGALVSEIGFDSWGRIVLQSSPDGDETLTILDPISRQVAVIEGWTSLASGDIDYDATEDNWEVDWNGSAYMGNGPDDADRVTTFLYDGLSNVVKRTAHFGDGSTQTTEYVYGTVSAPGSSATDSLISSSGLLQKVHYPNETSGDTDTSAEYTVVYGYNRLGELRGMLDQNGTTHTYARDDLGRVTSDSVAITDLAIDSTITEITTSYDDHGRLDEVLSGDGNSTLNSVAFGYSELHQVTTLTQNTSGSPSGGSAEELTYSYASADHDSGNYSRLSAIGYPTERGLTVPTDTVLIEYGDQTATNPPDINHVISRVSGMDVDGWDSTDESLVDYSYLGRSSPVKVHYPTPTQGLGLDYTVATDGTDGSSSGTKIYYGFDEYGRVIWHPWVSDVYGPGTTGYSNATPVIARAYEYDNDSNRTRDWDARPGAVPTDRDWRYEYDALDRLETAYRGQHTPGSGTNDFTVSVGSRQWDLDILGNWKSVFTDDDAVMPVVWESNQAEREDRSHNMANEIADQTYPGSGGTTGIITQPTYDKNGNYRQNQPSLSGANTLQYTHDAWNRLVKVEKTSSSVTVLENEYNGLNWRVKRRMDLSQSTYDGIDEERTYYYTASWQVAEERIDQDDDGTDDARGQQFWGVRYIDDAVAKRQDRDGDGVWTNAASDNWYYLTDVMFSVRGITDRNGDIHTRVDYTPYGVALHRYAADVNGDNLINFFDLSAFTTNYNSGTPLKPGDANYDPDTDLNGDQIGALGGGANFFEFQAFNTGRYTPYSTGGSNPTTNAGWIDNPTDTNGPDNSVGYDGYWFELAGATNAESTGLYCVRHRVFDPGLGRWIRRDYPAFVDEIGGTPYEYARSGPGYLLDWQGLAPARPPYPEVDSFRSLTKEECEERVNYILESDPFMKKLHKHIMGVCRNNPPSIKCGECDAQGQYNRDTNEITICFNNQMCVPVENGTDEIREDMNVRFLQAITATLYEELVHAGDLCNSSNLSPAKRCRERVCTEIRACLGRGGDKARCRQKIQHYINIGNISITCRPLRDYNLFWKMCGFASGIWWQDYPSYNNVTGPDKPIVFPNLYPYPNPTDMILPSVYIP